MPSRNRAVVDVRVVIVIAVSVGIQDAGGNAVIVHIAVRSTPAAILRRNTSKHSWRISPEIEHGNLENASPLLISDHSNSVSLRLTCWNNMFRVMKAIQIPHDLPSGND